MFGSLAEFLMSQKGLVVVREKGLGFHQNPDSIQIQFFSKGRKPLGKCVLALSLVCDRQVRDGGTHFFQPGPGGQE